MNKNQEIEDCQYHKRDNTCGIDNNPCFNVIGFENWECPEYEETLTNSW